MQNSKKLIAIICLCFGLVLIGVTGFGVAKEKGLIPAWPEQTDVQAAAEETIEPVFKSECYEAQGKKICSVVEVTEADQR